MESSQELAITIDGATIPVAPEMLERYSRPGPRYTSYPTAPEWSDDFDSGELRAAIADAGRAGSARPLSLYFHLPFCQSLCLFCGCNVTISRDHSVAQPYLDRLHRELGWIAGETGHGRPVEQIHLGGGTPTYLDCAQLETLFDAIHREFTIAPSAEISVEIEPRVTTPDQCRVLRRAGVNRLSMGVQDFDPLVQSTIRRVQPFEMTRDLIDNCRALGFESFNIDLIYGLPHQTPASFENTIQKVIEIGPDRIALFSYAHVPWLKKQQGSFARHLPSPHEKFRIFAMAIERLTAAGYLYIGLDHFVRPGDELARAQADRTLHRNFQGYTTRAGCDLHGIGVSSISALDDLYAQNARELSRYYDAIDSDRWPTVRGIRLDVEDRLRREVINRLLCHCLVVKSEIEQAFGIRFDEHFAEELDRLEALRDDGLVLLEEDAIRVHGLGRIFIRNVAMIFDTYLWKRQADPLRVFSSTL